MNKKVLSLLLALVMVFASVATLASCTQDPADNGKDTVEYVDPYKDITDTDELYAKIYADILGDFYTAYELAKAETNVS